MIMHRTRSTLVQDLYYRKTFELKSSVSEAVCFICGKGLENGCRITAKTLPNGTTTLLCDTCDLL
jgi:hypothetical protein